MYGVTVLDYTLSSYVPEASLQDASFGPNEFFRIGSWTVEEHVPTHTIVSLPGSSRASASSLGNSPTAIDLISTHHSPHGRCQGYQPPYRQEQSLVGVFKGLWGEKCWAGEGVVFWAFGHTHYNFPHWRDEETWTVVHDDQSGYHSAQGPSFAENWVVKIGRDGVVAEEGVDEPAPQPEPKATLNEDGGET
jgi:hypothetical protein